ncbi:glycosyl hydrolase family 43 [Bifidobacterium olomucense]|uniref:Glycosyl hydrolase family 43 protein n=1 Tax=Bifidobacterium olomucense TaxID=2675324 RepID=A0A7Y0EZD2_9BIFI|nr:glycosyl hydrolase family 43 [Bifidobacterium sp. DSM 109959]NMM99186.1 glycosyl hydrolase family 43 protein [Bifidobacterium sp. DSM 109959]
MSQQSLIISGVPWFDDRGRTVNAHGGCIVEESGLYYLFGEYKTDEENRFAGFSCYSSPDLVHWTFRRIVLPQQADGLMGPGRIGERVKVMRCPATGQYVMFMHSDDWGYCDPHICYAVCDTVDGGYEFRGPLTFHGETIRRWDLGVFQDDDGTGYLLIHEGDIYRLSDDYLSVAEQVGEGIALGGEAPAAFKLGGRYWMLFSNKTSWDCNDNYCLSASSMRGPWTYQGLFAPEGTMTCNSQTLYVLPVHTEHGEIAVYMGDRWSFPHQASAATYVWQQLSVNHGRLRLAEYQPAWSPVSGKAEPLEGRRIDVGFRSDKAGESVVVPFHGSRVALTGRADQWGSYARVGIRRAGAGEESAMVVDPIFVSWYAKSPDFGYRYVSPELPEDDYVLTVTVTGEVPQWTDKSGQRFGSVGSMVDVDEVIVAQ